MKDRKLTPSDALMWRIRQAFADYGYERLSMVVLAEACGFTRRALYHYFSSKEEAFRASLAHVNDTAIQHGLAAGEAVRSAGGDALDVLSEFLNVRYGDTWRHLNQSPHRFELNGEAFLRCHDLMISTAIELHEHLERLIREFADEGLLVLRPGMAPAQLARLLADGARGVSQSRPPIPSAELASRYRGMTEAILYGATERVEERAVPQPMRARR